MTTTPTKPTGFFERDREGRAVVRLKFKPEEASLFEEAAGTTPVIVWLYQALNRVAQEDLEEQRLAKAVIPPPE